MKPETNYYKARVSERHKYAKTEEKKAVEKEFKMITFPMVKKKKRY